MYLDLSFLCCISPLVKNRFWNRKFPFGKILLHLKIFTFLKYFPYVPFFCLFLFLFFFFWMIAGCEYVIFLFLYLCVPVANLVLLSFFIPLFECFLFSRFFRPFCCLFLFFTFFLFSLLLTPLLKKKKVLQISLLCFLVFCAKTKSLEMIGVFYLLLFFNQIPLSILPWGDRAMTAHPAKINFTIYHASTTVRKDGPSLLRQAEVEVRVGGHVCCQTDFLICVSISRSDGRHEMDSPFHAITKASRILDASAVLMMSINKGMKLITTIPSWRLRRNNSVIKSWRRWLLRGSADACSQKETNIWYKLGHSLW